MSSSSTLRSPTTTELPTTIFSTTTTSSSSYSTTTATASSARISNNNPPSTPPHLTPCINMSGLTAGEKFPEGGKPSDNIRWEHEQVKSDAHQSSSSTLHGPPPTLKSVAFPSPTTPTRSSPARRSCWCRCQVLSHPPARPTTFLATLNTSQTSVSHCCAFFAPRSSI